MIVVADASPLIHLSAAGRLELLYALYGAVLVPDVVYHEVTRGEGLPGALEVQLAGWIEVVAVTSENLVSELCAAGLDAGEASALAVAKERSADLLVVDERAARGEARRRGLAHVGTLGILLESKRRGLVDDLGAELSKMRRHGMRVSDSLVEYVLGLAGESESGEGVPNFV